MGGQLDYFTRAIEIQLLYAIIITLLVYAIPAQDQTYVAKFTLSNAYKSPTEIGSKFQTSLSQQQSFGVVDAAALALYSGNLLIDLILNFFGAIPSMASLVVEGILLFLNFPAYIESQIKLFVYSIVAIVYVISVVGLLLNIRTARGVQIG